MDNMRTSIIAAYKKLQTPVTGRGRFGYLAYNQRWGTPAVTCNYTPQKRVQEPQPVEPVTAFPLDYADGLPYVRRDKTLWERIKGVFCG